MNELKQLYDDLRLQYDSPEAIGDSDKEANLFKASNCGYCVGGAVLLYSRELWSEESNDYMKWYKRQYSEQWSTNNPKFPSDHNLAWGIRYIYKELTKGEEELSVNFTNWLANRITEHNDDEEFDEAWCYVSALFDKETFNKVQDDWQKLSQMFKETGVL